MLYLITLILLTLTLGVFIKRILERGLIARRNSYEYLNKEYKILTKENEVILARNSNLEQSAHQAIAIYDITKDMCKTLDEDKIFRIFKERMKRFVNVGDCNFIKGGIKPLRQDGQVLLPLEIEDKPIGYLLASDILEKDREKFNILAGQFLVAVRRALLYREIQELTITDSLTGAFSRRYFLERFQDEVRRAKKFKLNFSFLMSDVDHFKEHNDRYGHLVGDAILREVSKTIKENIRQIDFMGRYGGEELSIILTETNKEKALSVARRIRRTIAERKIRVYDEELRVTISIGIATFPEDADKDEALLEKADSALYQAKQGGRNMVCVYGAETRKFS